MSINPTLATAEIFKIYQDHGHLAYGEGMSQLSHAVQAGLLAKDQGYDEEIILAAFLHDIGHLCTLSTTGKATEQMGNLGVQNHDRIGEDFLRQWGCSDRLVAPVRNHVDAKRYLCHAEPGYYERLSEASKGTLEYQGGPMNAEEAQAFASDPYFSISLEVRRLDEAAKTPNFQVTEDHLAYFKNMLEAYLKNRI